MLALNKLKTLQGELSEDDEQLTRLFSALSDRTRFRIFKLLLRHKGLCVTEIAEIFKISVPAASQQLKIMEGSGLVVPQRHGQMICYEVKRTHPLARVVTKLLG